MMKMELTIKCLRPVLFAQRKGRLFYYELILMSDKSRKSFRVLRGLVISNLD
jgi:hypothetical protein